MAHRKKSPTPRPPRVIRTVADLISDERNANRGNPRGQRALEQSLDNYGTGRSVLIDRDGNLIAGNKVAEQAKARGLPITVVPTDGTQLVVVQRMDLDLTTDPRAQGLAIADNRVGELDLTWNVDELQKFQAQGLDLSAFWTPEEFATLFEEETIGLTDENAVLEPPSTDIIPGDHFALGAHRLLCGDATSARDVARVLDGATPHLMATDPPYGVHYDPGWRHLVDPSQRTAVGRVMNDDRATWRGAWELFPGEIAYVWHAAVKAPTAAADLEAAGFTLRSQIIWVKQHFALSRGNYHWAHEPAWYAVRGKGRWRGDRRQTTVWGGAKRECDGGPPLG